MAFEYSACFPPLRLAYLSSNKSIVMFKDAFQVHSKSFMVSLANNFNSNISSSIGTECFQTLTAFFNYSKRACVISLIPLLFALHCFTPLMLTSSFCGHSRIIFNHHSGFDRAHLSRSSNYRYKSGVLALPSQVFFLIH